MRFWGNLIGYQLVWFCAVIGAAHGYAWAAVAAFAVFASWQLAISKQRGADFKLIGVAIVLGICVDGVLSFSQWGFYASPTPGIPHGGAPIWILALWASFSLTLNETLRYLQKRIWLATIFGAVGGPIAYMSAARGFHAVALIPPQWHGVLILGVGWGVAMTVLASLARLWSTPNNGNVLSAQGSMS